MRAAALLILLAACGPSSDGGPDGGGGGGGGGGGNTGTQLDIYKSGSRIKMNVLTTSDGAKAFTGWHDAQLDVDCAFQIADDGSTRCFPTGITYTSGIFFADNACTKPVALGSCTGSATGQFATLGASTTSCPAQYRMTAFKVTGTTTNVFQKTTTGCTTTTIGTTTTVFTLGAALPASMFAEGTPDSE